MEAFPVGKNSLVPTGTLLRKVLILTNQHVLTKTILLKNPSPDLVTVKWGLKCSDDLLLPRITVGVPGELISGNGELLINMSTMFRKQL